MISLKEKVKNCLLCRGSKDKAIRMVHASVTELYLHNKEGDKDDNYQVNQVKIKSIAC